MFSPIYKDILFIKNVFKIPQKCMRNVPYFLLGLTWHIISKERNDKHYLIPLRLIKSKPLMSRIILTFIIFHIIINNSH